MNHRHQSGGEETLNPILLAKQERTADDIENIVELHYELHETFDRMVDLAPWNDLDLERLHNLGEAVKEIEFRLQEAWGFEQNAQYHSWWFQLPHCKCPILDNWDQLGTPYAITVTSCPYHGDKNV